MSPILASNVLSLTPSEAAGLLRPAPCIAQRRRTPPLALIPQPQLLGKRLRSRELQDGWERGEYPRVLSRGNHSLGPWTAASGRPLLQPQASTQENMGGGGAAARDHGGRGLEPASRAWDPG